MKYFIFSAVAFLIGVSVSAQDLHVLQVKGKVTNKNGVQLKSNDVLKNDDKLIFSSATDAVAVVSSKNGRFIIKPVATKKENEFVAIVKDAMIPGVKRLSTRSGIINNVIDFQTRFIEPQVLLDTMRLKVSTTAFPMTATDFFFMRYNFNGEVINKKLSFRNDTLLIIRAELFSVDGRKIKAEETSSIKLFHFQNNNAHLLTDVSFVIPDLDQLAREVDVLNQSLRRNQYSFKEEAYLYASEFYGALNQADFNRWMDNGVR